MNRAVSLERLTSVIYPPYRRCVWALCGCFPLSSWPFASQCKWWPISDTTVAFPHQNTANPEMHHRRRREETELGCVGRRRQTEIGPPNFAVMRTHSRGVLFFPGRGSEKESLIGVLCAEPWEMGSEARGLGRGCIATLPRFLDRRQSEMNARRDGPSAALLAAKCLAVARTLRPSSTNGSDRVGPKFTHLFMGWIADLSVIFRLDVSVISGTSMAFQTQAQDFRSVVVKRRFAFCFVGDLETEHFFFFAFLGRTKNAELVFVSGQDF